MNPSGAIHAGNRNQNSRGAGGSFDRNRIEDPESGFLRQYPGFGGDAAKRWLAAADRLGYRPSYGAKLLRGESTRTIGFAVTLPGDHTDTYLSNYTFRLLNGIGREASRRHYQVLLIQGEDYRYYMDVKRIDALVLIGFPLDSNPLADQMRGLFEHFNARNYPYVVINNQLPGVTAAGIGVDNRSGMRQVAELIRRKGYESAGFVGELTPNPQRHHIERVRCLREFLAGSGCTFDDARILNGCGNGVPEVPRVGRYSHADGQAGLRYLLDNKLLPRCIVCGNDDIATGLLKAAARKSCVSRKNSRSSASTTMKTPNIWNPP